MRLLIIPEDFRHDQYILRPLFERLVRLAGRRVRIEICRDPLLGGVAEALKVERLSEIVEQYRGMMDIFVLCVDRDGVLGRRQRLNAIEAQFEPQTVKMLGKKSKRGCLLAWLFRQAGVGLTCAEKCR